MNETVIHLLAFLAGALPGFIYLGFWLSNKRHNYTGVKQ